MGIRLQREKLADEVVMLLIPSGVVGISSWQLIVYLQRGTRKERITLRYLRIESLAKNAICATAKKIEKD